MKEAGVDLVTLAVFSWAYLEPSRGAYDFGWLDEIVERSHAGGHQARSRDRDRIAATVAYRDASRDADGRQGRGTPLARLALKGSAELAGVSGAALALCTKMANRDGDHPGLALWHVSNEIGCHNAHCFCDVSAEAFREWLRRRYGSIDLLNHAWGTAFWSQRYGLTHELSQ